MGALKIAAAEGTKCGKASASGYFDGNTTDETYTLILQGIETDDPEVLDSFPTSPLSGEWADSYSLRDLSADTGIDEDSDAFDNVCLAFEDAFDRAVQDEIERMARYQISYDKE